MQRWIRLLAIAACLLCCAPPSQGAIDVAVPGNCTPQVNQKLNEILASGSHRNVDNVMVCGMTVSSSRRQRGGRNGSHEVLPLLVSFPDGQSRLIEVVVNDDLDGIVTSPPHAMIFALGQAFVPTRGRFAAGIHDVHCSTHRGAENGWVVVNGIKHRGRCPL
jgi:hypothetical protein